jgi:hypothetical protein
MFFIRCWKNENKDNYTAEFRVTNSEFIADDAATAVIGLMGGLHAELTELQREDVASGGLEGEKANRLRLLSYYLQKS